MSDSDIVKDFLQESYENLDRLDRELVGLEKNPRDSDALASVFRTIHTIKGTCGFLGFDKLEKVAHVGENLLTRLRDVQLILNPEITTGLLSIVDAVRQMLKEIESTGQDGDDTYPELIATLTGLQEATSTAGKANLNQPAAENRPPADGHVDVAENQIDLALLQDGQGFSPIASLEHLCEIHPRLPKRALDNLSHHRGIVNDECANVGH